MTKSAPSLRQIQVLLLLLLCVCYSTTAFAQGDVLILKDQGNQTKKAGTESNPEETTGEPKPETSFQEFYDQWRDLEEAVSQGNSADIQSILDQITKLREHSSIPRMTEFAMSAILLGDQQMEKQKSEDALRLYHTASILDPSLGYAFFSESKAQMSRGPAGYASAIIAAVHGLLAPGSTITGKMYFQSRWLLILVATGAVAGFVFGLLLLIKYNRLLRHDAIERSRKDPALVQLITWTLLFLPVLLFFGPLWLAPFWFMLLWGYCRPTEKALAVLFFAIYMVAYPAYEHVAQVSRAVSNPSVAPYLKAFAEGASPSVVRDFEQYTVQHPNDIDGQLLLAYLCKTGGQYDSAIGVLQKIMVEHPSDARPYNNLANIYFVQGETDSALRFLEKTASLDSRSAVVLFNLSKAYRAKFNFTEAERLLEQARAANPSLVRELENAGTDQLVDIIPEENSLWGRINTQIEPFPRLFVNPFSILTVALFLLTFVINLGKHQRRGFARKCLKCGTPFCKKCQSSSQTYEFCTQCLHIFVKKDGVSPASRKEKMQEIEQYSDRRRLYLRISSLLMPGSANILGNATVSGIVVMLLWILFVVLLAFNFRFSFLSPFEPGEKTAALTLLYGIGLAVLYAFANIPLFQRMQRT
jgi:tetratricopeptide (TPR) repeat protein